MAFKPLTVNTSAEADGHIYAEDDASIYESLFGTDGVFNIGKCFEASIISNNKVRISDGVMCVGGHVGRITHADYQDMVIENGEIGNNRNDIIYAKFLTSGNVDSYTLEVKKGTVVKGAAVDPELVQDNLYKGAKERDYPLYRVKLTGLNITAVEKLFTVIPTIPEMQQSMQKELKDANDKINALNEGKLKIATFLDYYTVPGGSLRTIVVTKDNFKLKSSNIIYFSIATLESNTPDSYSLSNRQWDNSEGAHIFLKNNTSVQTDIPVRVTVFYS